MLTNTVTPFSWEATGASSTTIRATLSPSGSTTSTADLTAIQNAINSASSAGGGIVRLNAGTFYINGGRIQMRSNVRLQGPTRAANNTTTPTAILKAGANFLTGPEWGGYSMITVYDIGLSNMTIANVMVDMSEASFTAALIPEDPRLSAYAVELRGATNVVMDGVFVRNSFTYHIVVSDSTKFGVRNCNVLSTSMGRWNQLDGIHVLNSSKGDVVDNRVDNGAGGTNGDGDDGLVVRTAFGGAATFDINFRNNWVRGGRHGAGLQIVPDSGRVYNINIENNRFDGGSTKTGIRTGYYDGVARSVDNVKIGGAVGKGNTFVDCTLASVNLTEVPHTYCVVTYNYSVRSGNFTVSSAVGNINSNNTSTTTEPGVFGSMEDFTYRSFTNSAGRTSDYHLYASGRPAGVANGIVVQLHGDGAGEFVSPTSGTLAGYNAAAKTHNMLLLAPRTPDTTGSRTWWENQYSPVWLLDLLDYIRSQYQIDEKKIWFAGYSGGAEVQTYWLLSDYSNRMGSGGNIMLGGGGAEGLVFGRQPTVTFKTTQRLHWAVGSNDTNDGSGFNAFAASQGGYTRYGTEGFTIRSREVIPGEDHFQSENDGPRVLAEQLAIAYTAPGSGEDQIVKSWASVTLNGVGTGTWTQVSGTPVTLEGTGATRTFKAPASMTPQTLVFDYGGDRITVTVASSKNGIVTGAGTVQPVRFITK